jgi:hypothetical protein
MLHKFEQNQPTILLGNKEKFDFFANEFEVFVILYLVKTTVNFGGELYLTLGRISASQMVNFFL